MKKDLILRNGYQETAEDKIIKAYYEAQRTGIKERFVLALPSSSGKTEVTISGINKLFIAIPKLRVLILAHSTNVLKRNFLDRLSGLNLNFTHSSDLSDNSQVHITIPQNEKKIRGKYDIIIIDEGHENYLAEQEQRIVKNHGGNFDLILTATPSKLIAHGGFTIHAVGAIELEDKYFAKINIELVVTNGCVLKDSDYNKQEKVIREYKYTMENTQATMQSIIEHLTRRIQSGLSAEEYNNPSKWNTIKNTVINKFIKPSTLQEIIDKIGKSLFICDSITQANFLYNCFKEKKVNVLISHSECDPNSIIIDNFLEQNKGVLIVVDRCRIGYNDLTLMNVIDMSGTRNIDLIYQMMLRVGRGDQSMTKYYIKVVPNNLIDMGITETYVNAAINLMDTDFLLAYNGKNLNGLEIPILIQNRKQKISDNSVNEKDEIHSVKTVIPQYTENVIKTLKDVKYDLKKPISIYKMGTMIEAKNIIRGIKNKYNKKTFIEILETAKTKIIVDEEA